MKKFLKSAWGKVCIIAAAVIILVFAGLCAYTLWHYKLDKFTEVAIIELGSPLPEIETLLNEYGKKENASIVNKDSVDITKAGKTELVLSHNGKEETATLYIVDTVAPTVEFCSVNAEEGVEFNASDFVLSSFDLSPVSISFVKVPVYGDETATVRVSDASGNYVEGTVLIGYRLMPESIILELGNTLTKESVLLNPEKYSALLPDEMLDTINASPVGEYTITLKDDTCTVTVRDTVSPVLEVRNVTAESGSHITPSAFIVKAEDASEITTEFVGTVSTKAIGTFTVEIRATDESGNVSTASATLKVEYDITPPVLSGLSDLAFPKGETPDYEKGVSAKDAKDGVIGFTYDASKVDTGTAGTYYVTYTAKDSSGNTVSKRRKVTVNHNAEDTAALVAEVASKLSSDVLELRNYVRSSIRYNSNWGGDDPVWYGFKNRVGNCYVHALCLDALLKNKGYETKIIWVTDKTHYWNIVKINGQWRHIDSTPAAQHSVFNEPMTDEQRFSCLQGRDWDRTKWPECN